MTRVSDATLGKHRRWKQFLVVRSYQGVRFIERSEIPQELHVRLGQGRWLTEVRLIAEQGSADAPRLECAVAANTLRCSQPKSPGVNLLIAPPLIDIHRISRESEGTFFRR